MCRGPSEKKRICPPPLPSPPSAQNNSCPPKIVLKFKFFILLVNPSSYWYYLWKQVAGIWKLKAGTYNKAEGWYCWLTVPSEYRDWEKPLPRSFRGGERDSRLQVLRTFFLWRNRPHWHEKACAVSPLNTEGGSPTACSWLSAGRASEALPGQGLQGLGRRSVQPLLDVPAYSPGLLRPPLPRSPLFYEHCWFCASLYLSGQRKLRLDDSVSNSWSLFLK